MNPFTLGSTVNGCYPPSKSNVTRLSQYRGTKTTKSMARILVIEDEAGSPAACSIITCARRDTRCSVPSAATRACASPARGQARPGASRPDAAGHLRDRDLPGAARDTGATRAHSGDHAAPRRARRSTASSASRSAPTTTSSSRSACASWCCAFRRSSAAASSDAPGDEQALIEFGRLAHRSRCAPRVGRRHEVALTALEFKLLLTLYDRRNRVQTAQRAAGRRLGHRGRRHHAHRRHARQAPAREARGRARLHRDAARRRLPLRRVRRTRREVEPVEARDPRQALSWSRSG